MKWQNHKLCNAAIIYSITGNIKATIITIIGSTLPDVLEFNGLIRHRTITHYPYFYIIPLLFLYPFIYNNMYSKLAFWIMIGAIIHITLDSFSKSGIPYISPYSSEKVALNFYTTHTISEWLVSFAITGIFCILAKINGYLNTNHFTEEMINLFSHPRQF